MFNREHIENRVIEKILLLILISFLRFDQAITVEIDWRRADS